MGRFYKTARPSFVDDVIYQAPHELMAKALQVQDKIFDDTVKPLEGTEALYDGLDYVDKDADLRQQKMKEYNERITSLAEKAHANPSLARGLRAEINKARSDIEYDVKAGDFHLMDRAAKRRAKLMDDINKNKNISEDARRQAILKIDRDYQGVGQGPFADDIHIYDKIDEAKFQTGLKATINTDGSGTTTTKPDGKGYMITNGETKTYLTEERLEQIIDTDPTMDAWKREQLQTLERQLEAGEFANEGEMEAEYSRRLKDFKANTIEKLNFEKIDTKDVMSTDSAFQAAANRAQSAWQFNQRRKDKLIDNNYLTEIDGTVNVIGDDEINDIYGDSDSRAEGPIELGGKAPTAPMTPAQKRKILDHEKLQLEKSLKENGMTLEDFRDKMKTPQGRLELAKATGKDINVLSRQANYNKTYKFTTPEIENYDADNVDDVKEQHKFIQTTKKNLNQFPITTPIDVVIIDKDGNKRKRTMSIAQAQTEGLISGPQAPTVVNVPKTDASGAYVDENGVPLTTGEGENEVNMTLAQAKQSGRLAFRKEKSTTLDKTKPLLDVKDNELMESEQYKYNGAHKVTKKEFFNVIKNSTDENGNPQTVIFQINKKDKNINKGIKPTRQE